MKKKPDISYLLGLPAEDAGAYLESLECRPTSRWDELLENARANAFTVARMTDMDMLRDVKGLLEQAAKEGMTARDFVKELSPKLASLGWTGKRKVIDKKTGAEKEVGQSVPARLNLVFFQNMQNAYMAGRYRAMLANAEKRPWWMYVAVMDARTRPSHAALNGKVFRYDDPFWAKMYPPNGFYCRCTVRALDDDDLERLGAEPERGEGHLVSREIALGADGQNEIEQWGYQPEEKGPIFWADPGFAWSLGYATWGTDHVLAQKIGQLKSEKLYAQVVEAINNAPARAAAFGIWIKAVIKRKRSTGDAAVLGLVHPEVVQKAESFGLDPARIAVMTDRKVGHVMSDAHLKDEIALLPEQYENLAAHFASPQEIYWDNVDNCAIYIFPDPDPDLRGFLVLSLPSRAKRSLKKLGRFDGVVSAYRKKKKALQDMNLTKLR